MQEDLLTPPRSISQAKDILFLPRVIGFASTQGNDAIVKVSSPEIGQIDTIRKNQRWI